MKLSLIIIFFGLFAFGQTINRPPYDGTGPNPRTTGGGRNDRPTGRPQPDMEEFKKLYSCGNEWKKIKNRPLVREMTCGGPAKPGDPECKQNSSTVCVGTVKCDPTDELKKLIANEEQKPEEERDPRYLFAQIQYTAGCYKTGETCPNPTACVAEDISDGGPWRRDVEWDGLKKEILQKGVRKGGGIQ